MILYKVIQHTCELEYNTSSLPKRVILFYCHWFDPKCTGARVNPKYGDVDFHMHRRYEPFDLFIITHNVKQVYYVSYPTS